MDKTKIINPLKLPAVSQIGFIVENAEEAKSALEKMFGIGPWTIHETRPVSAVEPSGPVDIRLKAAIAYSGRIQIELIELIDGSCFYSGVTPSGTLPHHLGFMVNNIEQWIRWCEDSGIKLLHRGHVKHRGADIEYAYMDTSGILPVMIEFIQMRLGFIPFKMNRLIHRAAARLGI